MNGARCPLLFGGRFAAHSSLIRRIGENVHYEAEWVTALHEPDGQRRLQALEGPTTRFMPSGTSLADMSERRCRAGEALGEPGPT